MSFLRHSLCALLACGWLGFLATGISRAQTPIEGFLPMVGMALSNEYETLTSSATFFISQPSQALGGALLGPGSSAYYDIALLDTGAATHIITSAAGSSTGFAINQEGFDGTNYQTVGGATGLIDLRIEDPLGVYIAGLSNATPSGGNITVNNGALRGQTSFSLLHAPPEWKLPNIIGLPMAAHHQLQIRNSSPQIFALGDRTVRTPDIQTDVLGANQHGIQRRAPLKLNPGIGFVQGPIYIQNLDLITLDLHENPLSPSLIDSGALLIETDLARGGQSLDDYDLLFDTGASLTVISEQTAVRLGFDPILDTPDFEIQIEGSGGVGGIVPGVYLDELAIDTIGGSFVLHNVPVAVLDVANPTDPGNVIDGILGMNVFAGRDIVIDANPQIGQGGVGPSLYISDPVTAGHAWSTVAASASWTTAGSWSAVGVPDVKWDATVANVRGTNQEAVLSTSSKVFRATISGDPGAQMTVRVTANGTLTAFADLAVEPHGVLQLDGGHLDAQYIDVRGGKLTGSGTVFVGSGPLTGTVRVTDGGRIAPGADGGPAIGTLELVAGDVTVTDGTLAFDLAGLVAGTSHDQLIVDRFAFLGGELEVSLVGGFMPQVGDMFTLITAGSGIQNTFDTLSLPLGYTWDVDYFSNSVRLQVTGLGLAGDFNQDGMLNCADIDLLSGEVASGGSAPQFDLDGNGQVNLADVEFWIEDIKGTIMADANLDGSVNGQDFVVWNNNKFTSTVGWCSGDFNANGAVNGQDFVVWNNNKFTSASASVPVPEPTGVVLISAWLLALGAAGWRRSA